MGNQYNETGYCYAFVRGNNPDCFLSGTVENHCVLFAISVDLQCAIVCFTGRKSTAADNIYHTWYTIAMVYCDDSFEQIVLESVVASDYCEWRLRYEKKEFRFLYADLL